MVEQCARIESSPGIDDALSGCQWHLKKRTSSPAATWGNDINVGVVDNGTKHLHAAPLENVAAEKNHDCSGANQIVHPLNNHGTTVAGIIAAMGNAVGVRGAAPVPKSTATPCSARPPAPRATRWTQ